jgi:hypothetical protein
LILAEGIVEEAHDVRWRVRTRWMFGSERKADDSGNSTSEPPRIHPQRERIDVMALESFLFSSDRTLIFIQKTDSKLAASSTSPPHISRSYSQTGKNTTSALVRSLVLRRDKELRRSQEMSDARISAAEIDMSSGTL